MVSFYIRQRESRKSEAAAIWVDFKKAALQQKRKGVGESKPVPHQEETAQERRTYWLKMAPWGSE